MPKPNFQFEKRRREMMKAKKKEEKRLRKLNKGQSAGDAATCRRRHQSLPTTKTNSFEIVG
jgi:cytochrome c556